jgi:hypothetical protein
MPRRFAFVCGRQEIRCFEVTFLSTTRKLNLNNVLSLFILTSGLLGTLTSSGAQVIARPVTSSTAISDDAMLALPDAPDPVSSSSTSHLFSAEDALGSDMTTKAVPDIASRTRKDIAPGQQAPRLTVGDKILLGFRSSVTPFSMLGWAFSAGYSQAINGSPNYGTNGKAFAQRLGASAARNESEGVFSDALMAPIFHEDPRYYEMGRGHSFGKRFLYAATRTVITRTDDGQAAPNYALFAGNVAGAALTNAYYPSQNRGFANTAKTFGSSIGGSAIGFIVTEFYTDALEMVHLRKAQ